MHLLTIRKCWSTCITQCRLVSNTCDTTLNGLIVFIQYWLFNKPCCVMRRLLALLVTLVDWARCSFSRESLEKICLDLEKTLAQSRSIPTPDLGNEYTENVPGSLFEANGSIHLGPLVGQSRSSKVYSVRGSRGGIAIKYQSNCDDNHKFHPLTREFWFLRRIERLEISPKAYGLSKGVTLNSKGPVPAKVDTEAMRTCRKSNPTLRYLIMDKVGPSLHDHVEAKGPLSVEASINLGIKLISHIAKLNSIGIVHGDIFQRNVCFRSLAQDDANLVLIDFGMANVVGGGDNRLARGYVSTFPLYTPWEMAGYRSSYRDDLFRVLQLVAYLMNGPAYMDFLVELSKFRNGSDQPHPMFVFKQFVNIFEFDGPYPLENNSKVEKIILEILAQTRGLAIDQMPDYESIVGMLQRCLQE